jgi:hypothetical protein
MGVFSQWEGVLLEKGGVFSQWEDGGFSQWGFWSKKEVLPEEPEILLEKKELYPYPSSFMLNQPGLEVCLWKKSIR